MVLHFEELWEKCEQLHKEAAPHEDSNSLVNELMLKLKLYQTIDQKIDNQESIPLEEQKKIKSRVLGEILLTLTNLSLVDNINVYDALNSAYKFRSIEYYSDKYK